MATREVVVTPDSGMILSSRGSTHSDDQDDSTATLVGAPPYIDTPDTDSYVHLVAATVQSPDWIGFRYGPYPIPPGVTDVRVTYTFRVDQPQDRAQTVDVLVQSPYTTGPYPPEWPAIFDYAEYYAPPYPTPGDWVTVTTPPGWIPKDDTHSGLQAFLDQLAAGYLWIAVRPYGGATGESGAVAFLQLTLLVDGIPPLRQVQRDDGLLRSARRARGGRSRQGSLRQRGYL